MEKLASITENFSEWYQDVIVQSELADHSPTRGCMVIRPYGYAIWENIQKTIDKKFKEHGIENAYFPLLIPESFLKKEAKHVEGFSPELAVVTHAGGKELEEPLVVRPTSETIIYYMFSKWIKSWRDLPLKVNQWANVVRWEMRTRPFLRTSEFLWQEGHTAHASLEEASIMAKSMLQLYKDFVEQYLAIPITSGQKSPNERFAGAEETFTIEGMMQDGKALQMGTSHILSQSFSRAFDVLYQDQDGVLQSPFCTSFGSTTRLIGAMIMVHGDSRGIIIPPKIAALQLVIVPIYKTEEEKLAVIEKSKEIKEILSKNNISSIVDLDDSKTPGAKFYHWELKGVPIRLEIGPRDLQNNQVVLVNRLIEDKVAKKRLVKLDDLAESVNTMLDKIQNDLFIRAKTYLEHKWTQGSNLADFGPVLEKNNGFFQTGWCGKESCEVALKDFSATIRCLLEEKKHSSCFKCKEDSITDIIVAKAY